MSQGPVVAELGRPETPEETAARKAASSKAYRSSQTVRNLVAALIATLAVTASIVFGVPRGSVTPPPPVDLATLAAEASISMDRPVIVPAITDEWRVNAAELESGPVTVWDITITPSAEDARGFLRVAQAFDTDAMWAPLRLDSTAASGTITVDGREWDEYVLRNPELSANISYALGTRSGEDYVLVYGSLSPEDTAAFAATLTSQLGDPE